VPPLIAQMVRLRHALLASGMLLKFHPADPMMTAFNIFVALCMLIGGGITARRFSAAVPKQIGAPPEPQRLRLARRRGDPGRSGWSISLRFSCSLL
jgi:hypothetical protein